MKLPPKGRSDENTPTIPAVLLASLTASTTLEAQELRFVAKGVFGDEIASPNFPIKKT